MELTVRTGPQEYICDVGILDHLVNKLKEKSITKVALIHGEKSWKKAEPYLNSVLTSSIDIEFVSFNGECDYEEVNRIVSTLNETEAQAIVGVGGGKLVDTVKYAAARITSIYSIIIPTLASNCAPWTPLSVMYEDGVCLGFDIHDKQVSLLLIEPELIIDSPLEYFIAGIGDTIAKWYESNQILSQKKYAKKAALYIARQAADACRNNIFEHSQKAVEDFKTKNVSEEVVLVIETIISISGLVGGFGDQYARTTLAHAIHDSLTIYPQTHQFLHGNKVAYGVLAQLAYEENWNEIDTLTPFYNSLNFPKTLGELELDFLTDADLEKLSEKVLNNDILKKSEYKVDPVSFQTSLKNLESYFIQEVSYEF